MRLHGTRIAWAVEPALRDPIAELLRELPAAEPEEPAELRIIVRSAIGGRGAWPENARELFFHGQIRGFGAGGDLWLHDGASSVRIGPGAFEMEAFLAAEDAPESTDAVLAVMLFIALVIALRHRELFHLHAGVVLDPAGRPILIAGDGGSGKTTSTLALADAGFAPLADDCVLLARVDGEPRLLAFPKAFHLSATTIAAFPRLAALVGATNSVGKRTLDARLAFAVPSEQQTRPPSMLLFP